MNCSKKKILQTLATCLVTFRGKNYTIKNILFVYIIWSLRIYHINIYNIVYWFDFTLYTFRFLLKTLQKEGHFTKLVYTSTYWSFLSSFLTLWSTWSPIGTFKEHEFSWTENGIGMEKGIVCENSWLYEPF